MKKVSRGVAQMWWFLVVAWVLQGQPTKAEKLNLLFVIIDDMRAETNTYGSTNVRTPNFNNLASMSVQFTNSYTSQAICGPSRASLFTSKYPTTLNYFTHDNPDQERKLLREELVFSKYLSDMGYAVYGTSKLVHWVRNNQFFVKSYNKQPVVTSKSCGANSICTVTKERTLTDARALRWSKSVITKASRNKKKNWALFVGFRRPHTKFRVPKDILKSVKDRNVALPTIQERSVPATAPWQAFRPMCSDLYYATEVQQTGYRGGNEILGDRAAKTLRAGYFASVEWIDSVLGDLLNHVKAKKALDDTLIIVTSDHGWQLGEHGGWCKGTMYDLAIRTPLWIRDPLSSRAQGTKEDAIVGTVDLFPTITELLGVPLTEQTITKHSLEGKSYAHVLRPTEPTDPVVVNALKVTPQLADHDWSFPADAAFSNWPVCVAFPGSFIQVDCKDCVLKTTREVVDCNYCAEEDDDICDKVVRPPGFMGFSMKTKNFRYAEWRPWIPGSMKETFEGPPNSLELYDHSSEQGRKELVNLASDPEYADVMADYSRKLRARFVPCEDPRVTSGEECEAQGEHCIFMQNKCYNRGFCDFKEGGASMRKLFCNARQEVCAWNAALARCENRFFQGRHINYPTSKPTTSPTLFPTTRPSHFPTRYPTAYPTIRETKFPTSSPTVPAPTSPQPPPTSFPTSFPTLFPTMFPTKAPQEGKDWSEYCTQFRRRQGCPAECRFFRWWGCNAKEFCGFKGKTRRRRRVVCLSNRENCVWSSSQCQNRD